MLETTGQSPTSVLEVDKVAPTTGGAELTLAAASAPTVVEGGAKSEVKGGGRRQGFCQVRGLCMLQGPVGCALEAGR